MKRKLPARLLALLLGALILLPVFSASAAQTGAIVYNNKGYSAQKISNPTKGSGEADGIFYGEESTRFNAYAWCMEERDGYIYNGYMRNLLGGIYGAYYDYFTAGSGISPEVKPDFINAFTNGEFPLAEGVDEPCSISKIDPETAQTEILYSSPQVAPGYYLDSGYRMMIKHENEIFVGTNSSFASRILKIDIDDNVTQVYSGGKASSFRAATLYEDKLYFGGLDDAITDNVVGDKTYAKVVLLEKSQTDDTVWNRVADFSDFGEDCLASGNNGSIWDIIDYNGDIYVFLAGIMGFSAFKGHPARVGEPGQPNEYGWIWTEVIGANSEYPYGMIADRTGVSPFAALGATPVVFNGEMYFGNFNETITPLLGAYLGLASAVLKPETAAPLSEILGPLYGVLKTPNKLYKMDASGVITEVTGINQHLEGTMNEYLWRYAVYNDKLFIGSWDCASVVTYITQLADGRFCRMSPQELASQAAKIKKLSDSIGITAALEAQMDELVASVSALIAGDFDTGAVFDEITQAFENILATLEAMLNGAPAGESEEITELMDTIQWLQEKLDPEGIKMYFEMSQMVRNEEFGFDLFATEDGEDFTTVTTTGFNDKYNYGCRTLVTTDEGLYLGTANPFYGCQLWRITEAAAPVWSFTVLFEQIIDFLRVLFEMFALVFETPQLF